MFNNLIYFLIVLLIIYSADQQQPEAVFTSFQTLILFVLIALLFAGYTWVLFRKLEKSIQPGAVQAANERFDQMTSRQSILAIILLTIDIYWLSLSAYLSDITIFVKAPTLQAVLFVGIFLFYLVIIWACSFRAYQKITPSVITGRSYILSNIALSIVLLIPWFLISITGDVVNLLPFKFPKQFLSTYLGQGTFFLVALSVIAVALPVLIKLVWRCRPLEAGAARTQIEVFCEKAGMTYRDILEWPLFGGKMITAGVMGLVKRFRYILVTPSLLKLLNPEELDAVIAHEIGHIKKKHLLFYLFFFISFVLFLSIVTEIVVLLIGASGVLERHGNLFSSAFECVYLICIFVIYFRYVFGYFMRNFERQADGYAFSLVGTALPLVATFNRIVAATGQSADTPNWHHFSIKERIDFLLRCENNRDLVKQHNRKVKKSIILFFAVMVLICVSGFSFKFSDTYKKLTFQYLEKVLQGEVKYISDKHEVLRKLGDLFYSEKKIEHAIKAYEKSLEIKMDNPNALNNLAWLYATCEDETYRNPERALLLAEKAVRLHEMPIFLDTLAETYFVNGMVDKAIDIEKKVLKLAGTHHGDRGHFEAQLLKFLNVSNAQKKQPAEN